MLPGGCLEHLGRKDFQGKIRGLRVEIAEVEEALRSMSAIREAVVIAQEVNPGDKRLVAYIVAAGNAPPSVSEVRRFVEQKLPPFMVPSRFVMLDALPLTPTGKVNRRVLPDPGKSRPDLDTPFVAPRTPIEEKLSKIWVNVLSLDQVGIYDNFFDLGGHSLLAVRLFADIEREFKRNFPVATLLKHASIEQLSQLDPTRRSGNYILFPRGNSTSRRQTSLFLCA